MPARVNKSEKEERIAFIDELIQERLEVFPRAIEGKAPTEKLKEICREIRILREAKEHFLNSSHP